MLRDHEEKRDFRRMSVDCPVNCRPCNGAPAFAATARDLSATGLSLLCEQPPVVGELLEVKVAEGVATVPPLQALVEVARVTEAEGGGFEVGVAIRELR